MFKRKSKRGQGGLHERAEGAIAAEVADVCRDVVGRRGVEKPELRGSDGTMRVSPRGGLAMDPEVFDVESCDVEDHERKEDNDYANWHGQGQELSVTGGIIFGRGMSRISEEIGKYNDKH